MYKEIEGGTKKILKHGYVVWIPPTPPKSSIAGFEKPKKEQKWTRTPLPENWDEKRAEEIAKREEWEKMVVDGRIDPKKSSPFVDPVLEKFRRQEWKRRLEGYWFYNNGTPIYITGQHYFYLNWTRWDHDENDGYPIFYENQIDRFYFRQLCEEDPRSLGYVIIGPRGFGKSSEEISCIAERTTQPPRKKFAALQSKTEDDAQNVLFVKKLVPMFNDLPDFFKPINDHGTSPVSELSFKRQRVVGKGAKDVKYGPELELLNRIAWVGAKEKTLDGETLQDILQDEIGKTEKHVANVSKRTAVNRNSVFRNNRKVGIQRCCTTVEEMDHGGAECLEVWDDSDPNKRTPNGQTLSGLYKLFVSILECDRRFADDYGRINPNKPMPIPELGGEKKTCLDYHYAERKSREDDPEKQADWIRKHPIDEGDIRIKKGGDTTFNSMRINNYLTELKTSKNPHFVRGNFHWVDKEFGKVEFERDDISGRWQLSRVLDPSEANKWHYETGLRGKQILVPDNNKRFCGGVDPIKDKKTKNPRASKMSCHIFSKYDNHLDRGKDIENWQTHRFVARYNFRPEDPIDAYKEIAMGMMYFGCWANVESNVTNFTTWLKDHGMEKFRMTALDFDDESFDTKKHREDGIASTDEVQQSYINSIRSFIKRHFDRINSLPFPETLEELLNFEIEKVTYFDDVVSMGYALMGNDAIVIENEIETVESTEWFDVFDISGDTPQLIENDDLETWEELI